MIFSTVLTVGAGFALAAAAQAQTSLVACVNNKTHKVSFPPVGKSCNSSETALVLGATGPAGPPGPTGPDPPILMVNNNTDAPVDVPANQVIDVVPLAPNQFVLPSSPEDWVVVLNCTIEFRNNGTGAATLTPPNIGISGVTVQPGADTMIHWTDTIHEFAGAFITGPVCAVISNQPGQATGNVVVEAIAHDYDSLPLPTPTPTSTPDNGDLKTD